MIDIDDHRAMAEIRLTFDKKTGYLLMLGKPFQEACETRQTVVIVQNGDLNEAWRKLVAKENERTAFIDNILAKGVAHA